MSETATEGLLLDITDFRAEEMEDVMKLWEIPSDKVFKRHRKTLNLASLLALNAHQDLLLNPANPLSPYYIRPSDAQLKSA